MTQHSADSRTMDGRTGGFTLVELLVTVTIIAILAGITLGALSSARQTARIDGTRATIEKINAIIMERYESYRTRRLPMTQDEIEDRAGSLSASYASLGLTPEKLVARVRLDALRDLMRMEMPDRWSDVLLNPSDASADPDDSAWHPNLILPSDRVPALTMQYYRKYKQACGVADMATVQGLGAAECLYMIVMSDPETAAQFHADEIGDTDNDGLPEFLDGWRRPIRFLRWPAGFIPSLQGDSDLQSDDPAKYHDPFDTANAQPEAYATYPLIYSAGPDGEVTTDGGALVVRGFDINIGKETSGATYAYVVPLDPCGPDGNGYPIGQPLDDELASGGLITEHLNHFDNIHNHRSEGR